MGSYRNIPTSDVDQSLWQDPFVLNFLVPFITWLHEAIGVKRFSRMMKASFDASTHPGGGC